MRIRWLHLCIAFVLILIVVPLLMIRDQSTHDDLDRAMRGDIIEKFLRELVSYGVLGGRWPPATSRDDLGRPTCSWRLSVDPRQRFSIVVFPNRDAWFSPSELSTMHRMSGVGRTNTGRPWDSNYRAWFVAIVGEGTVFTDDFGSAGRVPDDTIILIEHPHTDTLVIQPGDLNIRDVTSKITEGVDGEGVFVGFADGQVWYLDRSIPFERLRKFFTVSGARNSERDELLLPFRTHVPKSH